MLHSSPIDKCLCLLLMLSTPVLPKVFFHSDFECGNTFLARGIRKKVRTISLVANPSLEEWPRENGFGIIETNFPNGRDAFRYERRIGNTLKGVSGIAKNHVQYVNIQTGNLREWAHWPESRAIRSPQWISVDTLNPLAGAYSAFLDMNTESQAFMSPFFPESLAKAACRFQFRISKSALIPGPFVLPILDVAFGDHDPPGIQLVRRQSGNPVRMEVFLPADRGTILDQFRERQAFVSPDVTHVLEYRVSKNGQSHYVAQVHLDGKNILWASVNLPPTQRTVAGNYLRIGKLRHGKIPGIFILDEIQVADTLPPPRPQKPVLRSSSDALFSTDFRSPRETVHHTASQWQIAPNNAWACPVFDNGPMPDHLQSLPFPFSLKFAGRVNNVITLSEPIAIPTGLQPQTPYLARVRFQANHAEWSEWSEPQPFTTPSSLFGKPSPSPKITGIEIRDPGYGKRLRHFACGQWVDFHVYLEDAKGWTNLGFLDLFLSGNSGNNTVNYRNRGGVFNPQRNYAFSFSFTNPPTMHAKCDSGQRHFKNLTNLHCPFLRRDSIEISPQKGKIRFRMKLLNRAQWGLWEIRAYAANRQKRLSPVFARTCLVTPPHAESGKQGNGLPIRVILGVALGLLLVIFFWKRYASDHEAPQKTEIGPLPDGGEHGERIRKIRQYVLEHLHEGISPKDVARELSVSLTWLGKIFGQATGKTVNQYLNEVRIEKAKILLCESNLNITQISMKVGFNSLAYFTQVFNEYTGTSPTEFRKAKTSKHHT